MPERALVEVRGPKAAIGHLRMACRHEAERRGAKAKVRKLARKRNRRK